MSDRNLECEIAAAFDGETARLLARNVLLLGKDGSRSARRTRVDDVNEPLERYTAERIRSGAVRRIEIFELNGGCIKTHL